MLANNQSSVTVYFESSKMKINSTNSKVASLKKVIVRLPCYNSYTCSIRLLTWKNYEGRVDPVPKCGNISQEC